MLSQFIKSQIQSVERTSITPPRDNVSALIIKEVAPVSIAATLGLKPGDLVESIEGHPASDIDFQRLSNPNAVYRYQFLQPQQSQRLTAVCRGVPLGMSTKTTPDAIAQKFAEKKWEFGDLSDLWDDGAWEQLWRGIDPYVNPQQPGFFGRLFGKKEVEVPTTPFSLMKGAVLCERGDFEQGMPLVHAYEEVQDGWTVDFMAITLFYLAKDCERQGNRDRALDYLLEAYDYYDSDRIAQEVRRLGGVAEKKVDPWVGQKFPVDYTLNEIDGAARTISLQSELKKMQPHQMLLLCSLGDYRVNGPYHFFMLEYTRVAKMMPDYLYGVHVVTHTPQRREDFARFFAAEDAARQENLKVTVLHDPRHIVEQTLEASGSPYVLAISQRGTVVGEGWPEDTNLWDSLVKCEQGA